MIDKPEIRFSDYRECWQKGVILDFAFVKQGFPFNSKKYSKSGKFNVITIGNVGGDRYVRNVEDSNKIDFLPNEIQHHQVLKDKDILISMTGNVGRVSLNKGENNLLNQRVDVLITQNNIVNEFLYQRLSTSDFERKMILNGQGAAQLNISNANIENYEILVPEKKEQEQISKFLENFDIQLEYKNNELNKLKIFKQSMLYKMFPKRESEVPEIRFSQFTEDWKSDRFSNLFDKLNNNTFSRKLLNYKDGTVKNIHYGDVLINYGFSVDVTDTNVPYINDDVDLVSFKSDNYLKTGDVVFADTAEDTAAGKMVEIFNKDSFPVLSGLHTYPCRPLINFAEGYLGIYMNTTHFHDELIPYMQGSKVTGFNYEYLTRMIVKYPTIEEQKRIVNFFSNLENLISNQEKEIVTLERLKGTLLKKMFA